MRALLALAVALIAFPASADVQKLYESGAWAAFAGTNDQGKFTCALMTAGPDAGRFLIEYEAGQQHVFLRMLKPSWRIPRGTTRNIIVSSTMRIVYSVPAQGDETELRGYFEPRNLGGLFSALQTAIPLNIQFIGGTEPDWSLATDGFYFVQPYFESCLKMPSVTPPTAPTQP